MHPADIPDEDVYAHVRRNAPSNIIFYGVGACLIAFVGSYFRTIGLILTGLYILILIASTINTAVVTSMWLVMSIGRLLGKDIPPDSWYMKAATLIHLFEFSVYLVYCGFLYYWFFVR